MIIGGPVYTVGMWGVSVSVAKDLIRLTAPTTASIAILRATLFQGSSASSAQLAASIYRASSAGTGTAATANATAPSGTAAYAGSAVVNLTADTTKSPTTPLIREGFNILSGFIYHPTPMEMIQVPPSGIVVLRLETAPAAALTMSAYFTFALMG